MKTFQSFFVQRHNPSVKKKIFQKRSHRFLGEASMRDGPLCMTRVWAFVYYVVSVCGVGGGRIGFNITYLLTSLRLLSSCTFPLALRSSLLLARSLSCRTRGVSCGGPDSCSSSPGLRCSHRWLWALILGSWPILSCLDLCHHVLNASERISSRSSYVCTLPRPWSRIPSHARHLCRFRSPCCHLSAVSWSSCCVTPARLGPLAVPLYAWWVGPVSRACPAQVCQRHWSPRRSWYCWVCGYASLD